jgi:hypothetical protein
MRRTVSFNGEVLYVIERGNPLDDFGFDDYNLPDHRWKKVNNLTIERTVKPWKQTDGAEP